ALSSGVGGEVRVGTGPVPVTRHGLGGECDVDLEVLGDAVEKPAAHPDLIQISSAIRAAGSTPIWNSHWAHHRLGVAALDGQPGIEARNGVRLNDVAADHLASADLAVVRAVRCRIPDLRAIPEAGRFA